MLLCWLWLCLLVAKSQLKLLLLKLQLPLLLLLKLLLLKLHPLQLLLKPKLQLQKQLPQLPSKQHAFQATKKPTQVGFFAFSTSSNNLAPVESIFLSRSLYPARLTSQCATQRG